MNRNINFYGLKFNKSIKRWDEAVPLGNAKTGCLIYGDGPLRFAIDRIDLWDNTPNDITRSKEFRYKNLIKLIRSGKDQDWKKKIEVFENRFRQTAYPSKISAGRMELSFGGKCDDIKSRLDIKRAVADFNIKTEDNEVNIETFTSAVRFVGVMRVEGKYSLSIHIPDYISGADAEREKDIPGEGLVNYNYCMMYPKTQVVTDGEFIYYNQTTHSDYGYGVVVLIKKLDGYDEIYYTIVTSDDDKDYIAYGKKQLQACFILGYEKLKKEHVAWWAKYWDKADIFIPDKKLERTYYRSYYLFGSTSRKGFAPMALQGVWTADNDALPPWRGDYHHDTNTQVSYQSYLKGNRLEEGCVFVDYLLGLKKKYKEFAKKFYGVNGYLLPATSSLNGTAMAGWTQYSLSPVMTIWAAQSIDEYYLYTGNKQFLKRRAYPFFKGIGNAIKELLEERDGKLYLPLSTSPEFTEDARTSYLEPNSNFDLSLLKYLFKTLKGYAEILGEDSSEYAEILSKLDDFALTDEKVLKIDKNNALSFSHRHFSHVMGIYPLHLINYDDPEGKEIINATVLNLEQLGTGWWVGFSFGMSAQIYAMAKNGNAAAEKLKIFEKAFLAENGFHLNGDYKRLGVSQWHYRPFTLEALFGYCDALQEMMLQEHCGYIELFPAIPDEWKEATEFKKLRSYGGVIVSAAIKNGKISSSFTVKAEREVRIKNVFGSSTVIVKRGRSTTTVSVSEDEIFTVNLGVGKTYIYAE